MFVGAIIFGAFYLVPELKEKSGMANSKEAEKIGKEAVEYINKNNLAGPVEVSLVKAELEKETKMYKLTIGYQGQNVDIYVDPEGQYLYFDRISLKESPKSLSSETKKATCESVAKKDNPNLDVFIMSYCPFGLQMVRALSEMRKEDPSSINNVSIRYIVSKDSSGNLNSLHGEKEVKEDLRQVCIREEQPDKFWPYLECFMQEGKTSECEKDVNIDSAKLSSCLKERAKKYIEKDMEDSEKYQVTGSPTLILNGERISEYDFGGRSPEAVKSLLCCGFNDKPGFCSKKFNESEAAVSFSKTTYENNNSGVVGACQ